MEEETGAPGGEPTQSQGERPNTHTDVAPEVRIMPDSLALPSLG